MPIFNIPVNKTNVDVEKWTEEQIKEMLEELEKLAAKIKEENDAKST